MTEVTAAGGIHFDCCRTRSLHGEGIGRHLSLGPLRNNNFLESTGGSSSNRLNLGFLLLSTSDFYVR